MHVSVCKEPPPTRGMDNACGTKVELFAANGRTNAATNVVPGCWHGRKRFLGLVNAKFPGGRRLNGRGTRRMHDGCSAPWDLLQVLLELFSAA
jgi:hypothetical protein